MAINGIIGGFGKSASRFAGNATVAATKPNSILQQISSIDDKILDELVQNAIKNRTGAFKTKPWHCDVRTLDEIGTALTHKEQLHKKIADLSARYKMDTKTIKINGESKEFTVYRGSQGGSNEGYWAKVRGTDELYYIKYGNEAQIRSEQLAGELYELGGIPSTEKSIVSYLEPAKDKYSSPREKIGVASKFMPINYLPTKEEASIVREGFGLDCWLANWDALKSGNVVMSGGNAARLDVGGALCFRARGGRKGASFGENVQELTSFFSNVSLSKPFIKDMTREELIESLGRVSKISDSQIISTVEKAAEYKNVPANMFIPAHTKVTGVQNPEFLKETLIARKNYIARFRETCRDIPQKDGESIEEYIRRIDEMVYKTEYKIPFEKIEMSTEVTDGIKGISMAERLSPSQKKIYEDSLKAYNHTSGLRITHNADNILTENSMLHATSASNLPKILENGITTGDLRGAIGSGTGCATQTPLCADFWDVQGKMSIKDYFARQRFNPGEANFLPRTTPGGLSNTRNTMVFVVDKSRVSSTIMGNSFKVCEGQNGSILYKDGNMAGHFNYNTHRAVPIGVPANAIDRIIIRKEGYSADTIKNIKDWIRYKGLDIKLYDLEGNIL